MSLQDILQSIDDKAKDEIKDLEKQAQEKKQQLVADLQKKVAVKKQELLDEAKRKADDHTRQAEFLIKSEMQRELLTAKKQKIEKAYAAALKKLSELKSSDLLVGLLKVIPIDTGNIIPAKGKESAAKSALDKSGKSFTLSPKTVDASGGFLFRSETLDINNTYEALVENIKDSTSAEVAKILFGSEEAKK